MIISKDKKTHTLNEVPGHHKEFSALHPRPWATVSITSSLHYLLGSSSPPDHPHPRVTTRLSPVLFWTRKTLPTLFPIPAILVFQVNFYLLPVLISCVKNLLYHSQAKSMTISGEETRQSKCCSPRDTYIQARVGNIGLKQSLQETDKGNFNSYLSIILQVIFPNFMINADGSLQTFLQNILRKTPVWNKQASQWPRDVQVCIRERHERWPWACAGIHMDTRIQTHLNTNACPQALYNFQVKRC